MNDDTARLNELKNRAKGLGWELLDKDVYAPWGYVLRKPGQATNLYTNSAVRLDPEDPKNPLTGLDSVSHMLDQIKRIQNQKVVLLAMLAAARTVSR
jgi:hypothetical protein